MKAYYRSIGAPVSCGEGGIADFDVERLSGLALEACRVRGMDGYPLEIIREIYTLCV